MVPFPSTPTWLWRCPDSPDIPSSHAHIVRLLTNATLDLNQEFAQGLKLRHGSAVIPIGQLSVGLPRHRALLFKALADACELPCRLLRGRFYTGGSEEKAVVMVRSLDQEVCHCITWTD